MTLIVEQLPKSNPMDFVDNEVLEDFRYYLSKVVEMFDYQAGIIEEFEEVPGVGKKSEFAEPNISMAGRYNYIVQNLCYSNQVSTESKVLNILLTHLYGGHQCPRVFAGELDISKGLVDFERVAERDENYIESIRSNILKARSLGLSVWDKWGLRVSVQNQGHQFVDKINSERSGAATLEWMSSWIKEGTVERLLEAESFKETVEVLTSIRGIGPYIGYHCAAGLSPFHQVKMDHSEQFVLPGPGAVKTIKKLFPNLPKEWNPTKICLWAAEKQEELVPDLKFHEHWDNVFYEDQPVYKTKQDKLFAITSEIAFCQYGVYTNSRDNPSYDLRRKKGLPDVDKILLQMKEL